MQKSRYLPPAFSVAAWLRAAGHTKKTVGEDAMALARGETLASLAAKRRITKQGMCHRMMTLLGPKYGDFVSAGMLARRNARRRALLNEKEIIRKLRSNLGARAVAEETLCPEGYVRRVALAAGVIKEAKPSPHGTPSRYGYWSCRCEKCRAAHRLRVGGYRRRRRAECAT